MEQWILAILRWRALTPEQQRDIRRRRLPVKVARSMAFEGEAVDVGQLERALKPLAPAPDIAPETRAPASLPENTRVVPNRSAWSRGELST